MALLVSRCAYAAQCGLWIFCVCRIVAAGKSPRLSWQRANPWGSLKLLRAYPWFCSASHPVILLYQLAHQVLQSVFVYYSTYRYFWSVKVVGYTLMALVSPAWLYKAMVVRRAAAMLSDRSMLMLGLTFGACGYAIYGLAPNQNLFWCGIPVFALVGFFSPGIQSMMTKRVGVDQQGQLQVSTVR